MGPVKAYRWLRAIDELAELLSKPSPPSTSSGNVDKLRQRRYNLAMITISSKTWRYTLIIGDLVALILFVLVGQADHGTVNQGNPLWGLLRASWEFALLWLLAGWPLDAFPKFKDWTARKLLSRALVTWLVTAPLSLLLRSLVLDRLNIPTLFLAATLVFGILFLWAWRLLLILLWRRVAKQ